MIYLLEQPQSLKNEEELIRLFPAKRREKSPSPTKGEKPGIWAYLLLCLGLGREYESGSSLGRGSSYGETLSEGETGNLF